LGSDVPQRGTKKTSIKRSIRRRLGDVLGNATGDAPVNAELKPKKGLKNKLNSHIFLLILYQQNYQPS
jgi:hypothetical protein